MLVVQNRDRCTFNHGIRQLSECLSGMVARTKNHVSKSKTLELNFTQAEGNEEGGIGSVYLFMGFLIIALTKKHLLLSLRL